VEGALGPGTADGTLGLFFLLAGRLGRRFTRAEDDPYRSYGGSLVLTTTRMTMAPFLHRDANVQARFTCISHGDKCKG
jgi:hypothetical protein